MLVLDEYARHIGHTRRRHGRARAKWMEEKRRRVREKKRQTIGVQRGAPTTPSSSPLPHRDTQ